MFSQNSPSISDDSPDVNSGSDTDSVASGGKEHSFQAAKAPNPSKDEIKSYKNIIASLCYQKDMLEQAVISCHIKPKAGVWPSANFKKDDAFVEDETPTLSREQREMLLIILNKLKTGKSAKGFRKNSKNLWRICRVLMRVGRTRITERMVKNSHDRLAALLPNDYFCKDYF